MKPDFHQLMDTGELPSLGPETRQSRKSIAELDKMLATQFSGSKLDANKRNLIRAVVLLWHDHLAEAHEIAQQDDGPDRGVGHERYQSVTEVDMHGRQQPMAEESADQAYCQIAGKPQTAEPNDVACHPADKQPYQENDNETLIHGKSSLAHVKPGSASRTSI